MADKFCKFCGNAHTKTAYPQHCSSCNTITWFSPSPVAVLLQPVWRRGEQEGDIQFGIAIGQRGINPMMGQWNLFAGFVDPTDSTVEIAAAREFHEETGEALTVSPETFRIDHTFGDGRVLLTFCHNNEAINIDELDSFRPNHECPAMRVAWEPEKLCFDSHTRALAAWFEGVDPREQRFVGGRDLTIRP